MRNVQIECQTSDSVHIRSAIAKVAASFGYNLKREQEENVLQLASGKDVFISLPTGYGKSLVHVFKSHACMCVSVTLIPQPVVK